MRRLFRVLAPVLVIVAGVLIARGIIAARPKATMQRPEVLPPAVRVIEAEASDHRFVVGSQGTVEPRTEIPLIAEVGGRVIAVAPSFEDGGFFERGDVLVEIDPTDYHLALTRARAEVKQAELNLAVQRADAEVSRSEWERLNGGAAPPLVSREPQLAQSEAALEAAKAAVASAERDLARTGVAAPFDGRVRAAAVDAGQVVGVGAALGRIYAIDYAEIKLPLATNDLGFVQLPMGYRNGAASGDDAADAPPSVRLTAELAGQRHTWMGYVVRTDGAIDPMSRRLNVIARVDDPYGRSSEAPDRPPLAVGLFVEAAIEGRNVADVFVLPRAALRPGDQLLVVDGEDRLHVRDVDVLRRTREHAVVGRGLERGERVVISPMEAPVDGMAVRPQGEERPAARDDAGTPLGGRERVSGGEG